MQTPALRSSLIAAVLALAACGPRMPPLSARGLEHVRPGYRVPLSGSAVILPILDCSSDSPNVWANADARQLAALYVPSEIWKQLGLDGAPQDGRVPESPGLCRDLVETAQANINVDMASPYVRERLREVLDHHEMHSWMVVITRSLKLGDAPPAPARDPSAVGTRIPETGVLQVSTYVYAGNGEIVFRGDLECAANGPDESHDCGREFEKIPARVTEMLDGFPRWILRDALVLKVPPADDDPRGPAARQAAVAPPHKPSRHRR